MPLPELVEREDEVAAIARSLGRAEAGEGAVAWVGGPPGAGKTRLVAAARALAAGRGLRVLAATGSALEESFAFGVVRQMLEPVLAAADAGDRAELLSGAARRAAAVLDPAGEDGAAGDLAATVHGLHWLIANLAQRGPLLVAVDDAQWCDQPSVRLLGYLARRLGGLPVALVVAERIADAPGRAEAALAGVDAARLSPAALSEDGVARVLEVALGVPPPPAVARECRARSGGNPFLVAELAAELRDRGVPPGDEALPVMGEAVPAGVARAIRGRVAALGPAAGALARALAVLGDGADAGVAGALADLSADAVGEAGVALAGAGIIDDDHPLRFRHPLVHDAVAAAIPALARGAAHDRAARLLARRGAAPGRVAAHLLGAPPGAGDPWVVDALRRAAAEARAVGAYDQAVAYLRRACDEPPDEAIRPGLLRELGGDGLRALHPGAAAHLEEAHRLAGDPRVAAELALELATARYYGGAHAEAVDGLLAAIEAAEAAGLREQALRLEALLGVAGRYDLSTEERVRGRVRRLAAGLAGDTVGERLVRSVAALEAPGPTAAGLADAARLAEEVAWERPWPDPGEGAGTVAMYLHAGRPDLAAALTERLLEAARAGGSPLAHAIAMAGRGSVALDHGDLAAAVADLEQALDTMAELAPGPLAPTLGFLLAALADAGPLSRGDELLRRHGFDRDLPERMLLNPLLHGRGLLRLAQGRPAEAAADLEELGRRQGRWGMTRPSPAWRSAAAVARLTAGDRDAARALAAEELRIAMAWDTPRAVSVATRAVALAAGGEEGVEGLARAVRLLDGTPWRLERVRAGVDLGAALRRGGHRRDARAVLAAAMDEAHACGAALLAERAAQELRASGARPRRHAASGADALTPSERRVAELAARGRTNREIAQHLFVTAATVETHLTRAYRKLGIQGRPGLAAALDVAAP
ncbi:MAG: AAA family ATPase [Thermoleophilia bacterium]